jgi:hypothetical protein
MRNSFAVKNDRSASRRRAGETAVGWTTNGVRPAPTAPDVIADRDATS